MSDDDQGVDLALIGLVLYGLASGVVTAVVLLDYFANISVCVMFWNWSVG